MSWTSSGSAVTMSWRVAAPSVWPSIEKVAVMLRVARRLGQSAARSDGRRRAGNRSSGETSQLNCFQLSPGGEIEAVREQLDAPARTASHRVGGPPVAGRRPPAAHSMQDLASGRTAGRQGRSRPIQGGRKRDRSAGPRDRPVRPGCRPARHRRSPSRPRRVPPRPRHRPSAPTGPGGGGIARVVRRAAGCGAGAAGSGWLGVRQPSRVHAARAPLGCSVRPSSRRRRDRR